MGSEMCIRDSSQTLHRGFIEDSQRTRKGFTEDSQRTRRGLAVDVQRTHRGLAEDSQRTHRGLADDSQRTHTEDSQRFRRGLALRGCARQMRFSLHDTHHTWVLRGLTIKPMPYTRVLSRTFIKPK